MFTFLINPILAIMSLSTATGVLLHDTRIDKATVTALALPAAVVSLDGSSKLAGISGDLHTHTERTSLSQAVHDLKGQTPRILPRNEDKKHTLPKFVARGHHAFDNYNLPIV
jgi:hypothetical protein